VYGPGEDDRGEEPMRAVPRLGAVGASLRRAASAQGRLLARLWRQARPILRISLQILLALFIVFEEWGWRPLAELIGRLARWQPWARLEFAIARLPPYAALVAFALPTVLLLPLKFLALFLIGRGQFLLASALFIGAKVFATALVARLFTLTQPALMQIGWFAWSYDSVMPWKEALTERVRASWPWRLGRLWKERLRRRAAAEWRKLAPGIRLLGAALGAVARRSGRRLRAVAKRLRQRLKWPSATQPTR
jgi:hypothetical protein